MKNTEKINISWEELEDVIFDCTDGLFTGCERLDMKLLKEKLGYKDD